EGEEPQREEHEHHAERGRVERRDKKRGGQDEERLAHPGPALEVARELEALAADRQREEGDPPGHRRQAEEDERIAGEPGERAGEQRAHLERGLAAEDDRARRAEGRGGQREKREALERTPEEKEHAAQTARERGEIGPEPIEGHRALERDQRAEEGRHHERPVQRDGRAGDLERRREPREPARHAERESDEAEKQERQPPGRRHPGFTRTSQSAPAPRGSSGRASTAAPT